MKRNSPMAPGRRKVRPKVPDGVRVEVAQRTRGHCHLCLYLAGVALPVNANPPRRVPRIVHLHHVFPVEKFPELAKRAENLIGMCLTCHFDHESAMRRIPREALLPATMALADGDGPRTNYLERTYPLTEAGRHPVTDGGPHG